MSIFYFALPVFWILFFLVKYKYRYIMMPKFINFWHHYINNSVMNTDTQQSNATLKRFAPNQAAIIPAVKLIKADSLDCVAFNMAGNVIIDKVT